MFCLSPEIPHRAEAMRTPINKKSPVLRDIHGVKNGKRYFVVMTNTPFHSSGGGFNWYNPARSA